MIKLYKMEQNVIGLIEEEISFVKKDEELAHLIIEKMEWGNDEEKKRFVYACLRYNMFTVKQFSDLAGIDTVTLNGYYSQPKLSRGEMVSKLDFCYPHKSLETLGPKFIYRNEKSIKLLMRKK